MTIPISSDRNIATSLFSSVNITQVAAALGAKVTRSRCRAFWRKGVGLNVTLNDQKGCWYDHVAGHGGGILDLIQKGLDSDRRSAMEWLARFAGRPLEPWTCQERSDFHRRMRSVETEAVSLAAWRKELIDAGRNDRNLALATYHRARRLIVKYSLDDPRGEMWADACELYEERYQKLDEQIDLIVNADWETLADIYITSREGADVASNS